MGWPAGAGEMTRGMTLLSGPPVQYQAAWGVLQAAHRALHIQGHGLHQQLVQLSWATHCRRAQRHAGCRQCSAQRACMTGEEQRHQHAGVCASCRGAGCGAVLLPSPLQQSGTAAPRSPRPAPCSHLKYVPPRTGCTGRAVGRSGHEWPPGSAEWHLPQTARAPGAWPPGGHAPGRRGRRWLPDSTAPAAQCPRCQRSHPHLRLQVGQRLGDWQRWPRVSARWLLMTGGHMPGSKNG